jgi:hypothetical protein
MTESHRLEKRTVLGSHLGKQKNQNSYDSKGHFSAPDFVGSEILKSTTSDAKSGQF